MERITAKYKIGALFPLLIILISAGFVITETAKFTIASRSWDFYKEDFNWVKSNTQEDDLIMAGGQCMAFYLDRLTVWPKEENIGKASYVFINQDFKLDKRTITPPDILKEIKNNGEIVYLNEKTKTEIYKLKQ